MVTTRKLPVPSVFRASRIAFASCAVVVGQTERQPVYTKFTTSGLPR